MTNFLHAQCNKHVPLQSAIGKRVFADESHITPDEHPWLVFLDKPMSGKKTKKNTNDLFPWLQCNDPHQNLSDMEILKVEINLEDSILNQKEHCFFYEVIYNK